MKPTNDMELNKTNDMENAEMQETELEQISGGWFRHADSAVEEVFIPNESGSWNSNGTCFSQTSKCTHQPFSANKKTLLIERVSFARKSRAFFFLVFQPDIK